MDWNYELIREFIKNRIVKVKNLLIKITNKISPNFSHIIKIDVSYNRRYFYIATYRL